MSEKKVYFDKKRWCKVEEVSRGNIPPSKVVLVQLNEVGTGAYYYVSEALLNSDRFEEVEG